MPASLFLSCLRALACALLVLHLPIAVAADQRTKTVMIVGDSLSAGFGLARDQAWPALLAQRLEAQKSSYRVTNISISGETTAGGRSRLAPALEQFKPATVVIALGANDGLRGLPLKQMRDHLAAMIRLAQSAGARVLLVGMRLPPNYGSRYADEFAASFATVARSHRVPLLPFLLEPIATDREAFQADGLHPVAAAQARILDHVMSQLGPLLR